jgi:hypothetical protein
MTTRDLGFVSIKLLGLYCMLNAAHGLVGMLSWVNTSETGEWLSPRSVVVSYFASLVLSAAFAAVFLFLTEPLADWLFPAASVRIESPSTPRLWMNVGFVLIGVYLVSTNLTEVLRFLVLVIWNLEGMRRKYFDEFIRQSWKGVVDAAGAVIIGVVLCLRARPLAYRLTLSATSDENTNGDAGPR